MSKKSKICQLKVVDPLKVPQGGRNYWLLSIYLSILQKIFAGKYYKMAALETFP